MEILTLVFCALLVCKAQGQSMPEEMMEQNSPHSPSLDSNSDFGIQPLAEPFSIHARGHFNPSSDVQSDDSSTGMKPLARGLFVPNSDDSSTDMKPLARGLFVPNSDEKSDDSSTDMKSLARGLLVPNSDEKSDDSSNDMKPFAAVHFVPDAQSDDSSTGMKPISAFAYGLPGSDDSNTGVMPISSFARRLSVSSSNAQLDESNNVQDSAVTIGLYVPNSMPDKSSTPFKMLPEHLRRLPTPNTAPRVPNRSPNFSNTMNPSTNRNRSPISGQIVKPGLGTTKSAKRPQNARPGAPRQARVSPSPGSQKYINCSSEGFVVMNDCCKELTGPFFKQDARYKCYISGESIWATSPIKEYILNKMYSPMTNKLDLPNAKVRVMELKLTECIFKAEGLLLPSTDASGHMVLNTQKISNYFKEVPDNADAKVLLQNAVDTCLPKIPRIVASQQRSDVNVLPYIFVQCIKREMLMTCTIPAISQEITSMNKQGTFRGFAEFCQNKRNALRSCPIFNPSD